MAFNGTTPPPVDPEYPDVDQGSCQLLGPTALVVQALMGVFVICSLAYKRQRESPKRPWKIWLFDVSKQVVGQLFVHGANVLVSDVVAHHSSSNACVFYFLNILIDTTLGVALIYLILRVLTHIFTDKLHMKGFESGVYGSPPSFKFWARQATIYVITLTTMKFLVIGLLALFPGLDEIGAWLLSWTWTDEGDSFQVIFTMGIFPIIMNVLQFWLIDSIVKASAVALTLDSDTPDAFNGADREPLFGVPSDDEDDGPPQRADLENQRHNLHSRSPSPRTTDDLDKTISGSITPFDKSSGSSTPGGTVELHEYPPTSSSSPPVIKEATKLNKKRRTAPSPLTIQAHVQPAVNSPLLSSRSTSTTNATARQITPKSSKLILKPIPPKKEEASAKEWADSWEDTDDWANRVGEEEWTGRRMGEKVEALHDVWGNQTQTTTVHIGS